MAAKKTRVSKKPKGAAIKDLKPTKNPKGGYVYALGRIEPRYPR